MPFNFKPIHVSATQKMSESLLVTGFPYDFKDRHDFARHLTAFLLGARGVRRDGISRDRYGVRSLWTV